MASPIKDIVVYIDKFSDDTYLESVAGLAYQYNACATGLYVVPPLPGLASVSGEGFLPLNIVQQYDEATKHAAEKAQTCFEKAMEKAGVKYNWETSYGDAITICARRFRLGDVNIIRQPGPVDNDNIPAIINQVLLDSGRPLLIIPYIGNSKPIGQSVVVGWDGSPEATRAIHDAMPILKLAGEVEVVHVETTDEQKTGASVDTCISLCQHLTRHGVNATATNYPNDELEPGSVLLNRVSDRGANLIVAGAWGHSRASEYLFGGTTRTLLKHMTVPVWMSH